MLPAMDRIGSTEGTPVVQMQRAAQKIRPETEQATRVRFQESLALKQEQSLAMVQIMLHVSFGTLFYLREFLPLGCFDDRDLKQAQRERQTCSYEDFIYDRPHESSSNGSEQEFGKGRKGQPLKVIIRNSDPKADEILDLLENGIFEALSKQVLEAIQLTILVNKDEPQNVLETYTFSFKYTGAHGDVNSRLESLSLDPVGCVADMGSVHSARIGLEMIIRRLITLSTFLPILPNKRNLGVHLFYTDHCPSDYEPPGFAMSKDETLRYPLNENWQKGSQSCGTMDGGCHTVGLKVTSLRWIGPEPEGSEALPRVPDGIEYNDTVERAKDASVVDMADMADQNGSLPEATQDITERQKLQRMIPTQPSSFPDSDLVPTQPIGNRATREDTPDDIQYKMCLSHDKALQIDEYSRKQAVRLMRSTNNQEFESVKCQCGWDGEETTMITCNFCHTRQHLLCYGFEGLDDPRIPDTHVCYQCLLEPDEVNILREVNTVVLLRRALRVIMDEGYPNKTSTFTDKLHCNGQTVIQATDILRKQKFIHSTPGFKSKGFAQKGLPKYMVATAKEARERMQQEILDPFVKIRHHYTPNGIISEADESESQSQHLPSSSTNDTDMSFQVTQNPGNEACKIQGELASKGRQALRLISNDVAAECQKEGSAETRNNGPEAHIPSNRGLTEEPGSRKRRKISNYTQFIDVGASSSSDEGGQPN